MKFTKEFRGVPTGLIYPVEYRKGEECPLELEAGATALGALEVKPVGGNKPPASPPPPPVPAPSPAPGAGAGVADGAGAGAGAGSDSSPDTKPTSKPSDGLKVEDIKAALAARSIPIPEGVTLKADLAKLLDDAPAA